MKTLIYIIGKFFLETSCYQQEFHPESGDLIFQVGIAGGMTEAIADATGGESDLSFTHVGIITVEPAGIYVLEAQINGNQIDLHRVSADGNGGYTAVTDDQFLNDLPETTQKNTVEAVATKD